MSAVANEQSQGLTPRQTDVLDSALRLLVEGGERALTTAGVARAANCSKESLYKWFGDRNGLLAAVITHQASKVRVQKQAERATSPAGFRRLLVEFAADLLRVLAGDVSLALNRLAIGQASRDGAALGRLVLQHGRLPIEVRARALLETGRALGHLAFADTREAYRVLYGLVVRDMHVRLLLGDQPDPAERDPELRAAEAIDQFLRLHKADRQEAERAAG